MNSIWILTKKELSSFFDSLIAYMLLVLFLLMSGFFTWTYGNSVFTVKQANLDVFFFIAYWTLFFFIPALTMRTISEERRNGTLEWLCTRPISDIQIIIGKSLACFLLVMVALLFTLPYYITVAYLGPVDHGAILGGYKALGLLSMAYIGIGIFASSCTANQVVAFLSTLGIAFMFHFVFGFMANYMSANFIGKFLYALSSETHFESMSRGVIDFEDIFYFLSVCAAGVFGAQLMLSKRLW